MRNFGELLHAKWDEGKFLCVGLDVEVEKMPESVPGGSPRQRIVAFNRAIIDATRDLVCAFKPNSAFYEAHGDEGIAALRETLAYLHEVAPEVPIILDAKRGDIGSTNDGYVQAAFEYLRADAITVHPYMGRESLEPFLARKDKGIFVLCRTSNQGAGEFQDLKVDSMPLYQMVAKRVVSDWNAGGNCGVVVGATYPDEMKQVRGIIGDMPMLVPGIGAQNGDLPLSVAAGKDAKGRGLIMAVSRAVMYASSGTDFAEAARSKAQELHGAITQALVE